MVAVCTAGPRAPAGVRSGDLNPLEEKIPHPTGQGSENGGRGGGEGSTALPHHPSCQLSGGGGADGLRGDGRGRSGGEHPRPLRRLDRPPALSSVSNRWGSGGPGQGGLLAGVLGEGELRGPQVEPRQQHCLIPVLIPLRGPTRPSMGNVVWGDSPFEKQSTPRPEEKIPLLPLSVGGLGRRALKMWRRGLRGGGGEAPPTVWWPARGASVSSSSSPDDGAPGGASGPVVGVSPGGRTKYCQEGVLFQPLTPSPQTPWLQMRTLQMRRASPPTGYAARV